MEKLTFKEFEIVPAYEHGEEIAELFSEYTQMLKDNDPKVAAYLELQNYDDELADLRHKYGEPDGRSYTLSRWCASRLRRHEAAG